MSQAEEILSYWFGTPLDDKEALQARVQFWFKGSPEIDREIQDRFSADVERARRGELASWAETPRGRLALIILLDQFSRNIYRGTPAAFAQDGMARELCVEGLDAGMDASLTPYERMFFSLPLGHSENLADQERAVGYCEVWTRLLPDAQRGFGDAAMVQAVRHRDVIVRFGRFPSRNAALGRESTPEEEAYAEQVKQAGESV